MCDQPGDLAGWGHQVAVPLNDASTRARWRRARGASSSARRWRSAARHGGKPGQVLALSCRRQFRVASMIMDVAERRRPAPRPARHPLPTPAPCTAGSTASGPRRSASPAAWPTSHSCIVADEVIAVARHQRQAGAPASGPRASAPDGSTSLGRHPISARPRQQLPGRPSPRSLSPRWITAAFVR